MERQRCRGRLSAELIRRPKRIAFIVYQSVLAFIGLVFAIANLIAGPLVCNCIQLVRINGQMARRLRKAVENPDAKAKLKVTIRSPNRLDPDTNRSWSSLESSAL